MCGLVKNIVVLISLSPKKKKKNPTGHYLINNNDVNI